jgi:hypothetical protein
MDHTSSDMFPSGRSNLDDFDIEKIEDVKFSDMEILSIFPNLDEEQLDKLKNDLITITEILYKIYDEKQ